MGDAFKQLLVQMIATAARNKIAISLGLGGGLPGLAGAAGGGLLGGDGGMGGIGGIGSILKLGKSLLGPLKNLGQSLGLIAAPQIAGGAAAVAAGGAVAGGAGGFGAFGLAGAGAAGGAVGGAAGAAALAGPIGLGIGAVIAMGGPLIFAALKTKTKILDEGLKISIDSADTLVQTYTKLEKSQFFGLSKKVSERTGTLSEDEAGPIREVVQAIRDEVRNAADSLNVGADALDSFSAKVKLSFKDLSEADQQAKLQEALEGVRDKMARLALAAGGAYVEVEGAGDRLQSLAQSLVSVNAVLDALGHNVFQQNAFSALQAEDLAGRFGGADAFAGAASEFFSSFHSEAERMATTGRRVTSALSDYNVELPASLSAYRDIVEAQSLYTASGRELYATLLQLAPEFAAVMDYESRLADEREQTAEATRQAAEAARQAREESVAGIRGLFVTVEEQIAAARQRITALGAEGLTPSHLSDLAEGMAKIADAGNQIAVGRLAELAEAAPLIKTVIDYEAQLADQREQAAEATRQAAEAELQRIESERQARATAGDRLRDLFVPEADRMAERRAGLEASGVELDPTYFLNVAEAIRKLADSGNASAAQRYEELVQQAPILKTLIQYEEKLASERQRAAEEAARLAEAERERAEAERASGAEQARQLFTPQADLMASLREELTGGGVPLVGSEYLGELKRLRDVDVERYDALLAYAPQLRQLIDYEQELADEREAGIRRVLEATRQAILDEITVSTRSAQEAAGSVSNLQFNVQRRPSPSGTLKEAVGQRGSTTGPDRELLELEIFHRATVSAIQQAQRLAAAAAAAAAQASASRIAAEGHMQAALNATTDEARTASTAMAQFARESASASSAQAAIFAQSARSQRNLAVFADSIRHLNLNLDIVSRSAEGAANSVVKLLGGTDDFQARVASYYQNFFTQGERLTNAQDDLTVSFRQLGIALPDTRREFRALVEAQDLTTKSGQEVFASLIDLSDQFSFVTDEANNLNDALGASQRLFRTQREETFARTANQGFGGDNAPFLAGPEDVNILRELIRAINEGNIKVVRELEDLRYETARGNFEPTRQTL